MGRKSFGFVLIISLLAVTMFFGAMAAAQAPAEPPYKGVIRNFTKYDISFYSKNSQGTIVVPAKSWSEYVVWHDSLDLIGYVKGDPYFCKKLQVMPGQFPFNCKNYDFLAIIGEEPTAVEGLG